MKRLLLLLVICGVGYLVYTGDYRFVMDYLRPDKESDIPAEYRGKYVTDMNMTRQQIRQNNRMSAKMKKELSERLIEETMNLRKSSIVCTEPTGKSKSLFGAKVIDRGPNWILIENTTQVDRNGEAIIYRITRDAAGLWVAHGKPPVGFMQRLTKLN